VKLDILLPLVLFLVAVAIVFIYTFYEKKVSSLFGGKELRVGHAVSLVVAMGVIVTVLIFVPEIAIMVFFLFAYSVILFLFMYLVVPKWYLGVPIPFLFIALYFLGAPYWNIYLFDFFAIIFAVSISVYLGSLFTWKTTVAFVVLVTVMDIIQVLITGHMITSGEKVLSLGLPVGIILPTFPYHGGTTFIGLGDVFLLGLLGIQTTRKYGRKTGLESIASITLVFLLLLTVLLNYDVGSFPATVFITGGWLTALTARYLHKYRYEGNNLLR
jgi:presenilin-like A22 family membrane protease